MTFKSPNHHALRGSSPALAGPWTAVLADDSNYVYPTVQDALDALGAEATVSISVVRGSALPANVDCAMGGLPRRPEQPNPADIAYDIECYLVAEGEDEPANAAHRYEQALAMAAGLNAAAANPDGWDRRTELAGQLHDLADRLASYTGMLGRTSLSFYNFDCTADEAARVAAVDELSVCLTGEPGTDYAITTGGSFDHGVRAELPGNLRLHVYTPIQAPAEEDPAVLRAERDALRAQLAELQGGVGAAVVQQRVAGS